MANTILTIDMITKEALRILVNQLSFTKFVSREYDDRFAVAGAKIGDTLRIRKPVRYVGRSGAALSTEDFTETSVNLTLTTQFGVDAEWSSKELTLSMDDFARRHLVPAMATIANKIDYDGLQLYQEVYNQVGTPGTTPSTAKAILDCGQRLDEEACPRDRERTLVVNPAANAALVDGLKGLFVPPRTIGEQFETGSMGWALGFRHEMDQNVRQHTTGAFGGTPLVNGANQTGSSLVTDGWPASTAILKKGDIITIAGVNAVNPQNRQDTGSLRQFVVTADTSSDATGNATIPISPPITPSGAYQTVTNSPADNAAITPAGDANTSYPINLAFHRDAFVLGTADLVMPEGTDMASRQVYEGISLRIVRQYTISNDMFPTRIDVLYGWACVYPELAVRLIG